ncbi:hypothetical protein [Rhodococcus sp. X156]|nr:hypothetical protein [Rhodococcus sp. X156]
MTARTIAVVSAGLRELRARGVDPFADPVPFDQLVRGAAAG